MIIWVLLSKLKIGYYNITIKVKYFPTADLNHNFVDM